MQSSAVQSQVTPERLMQLAWGYAPPLIVEAAVRHRVFDVLDNSPKTVEQISSATGAALRGLRAIVNALVGLELLAKDAQGRFTLTPESAKFLVSGQPDFLGGMIRHTSEHLMPRWLQLNESVRTGRPTLSVNREDEGARFFQQFVEDLFPLNYPAAQTLADALGLAGAQQPIKILDLAAGSGVWGIALAQKSPHVQVTAVDWAGVIPVTHRVVEHHGLTNRFRFLEGDLQKADFGSGYDVAVLGHILHSEGEERGRALLQKTCAALASGGTAAIAEWTVNEDRTGPAPALIFAVNMLVNTDRGDTFSFNELRRWLEEAGFEKARTIDAPGPSPLILAEKKGVGSHFH